MHPRHRVASATASIVGPVAATVDPALAAPAALVEYASTYALCWAVDYW